MRPGYGHRIVTGRVWWRGWKFGICPPQGPEEARGPYLVRLEIQGTVVLRAEVHVKGPGAWVIYEDP